MTTVLDLSTYPTYPTHRQEAVRRGRPSQEQRIQRFAFEHDILFDADVNHVARRHYAVDGSALTPNLI